MRDIQKTVARETDDWRVESLTLLVEPIIRTNLLNCMLNWLNREILHSSGKSQGTVREFQKSLAVATMLFHIFEIFSRLLKREDGQKI